MKPFNLEEAKAGKSVCTRSGRSVKILYFDMKGDYPIVAMIDEKSIYTYTANGFLTIGEYHNSIDLFMTSEKKEGWINIYPSEYNVSLEYRRVYDSEDEAVSKSLDHKVATIKIEWEE